MWEVDPETKSKLLSLQSLPPNKTCCDCLAPSPQWASPKFGTFICLSCAGLHRGLGVHISFVRSISMDAFKGFEIKKMEMGGNEGWKKFWEGKHPEVPGGWDGKEGGAVGAEERVKRYDSQEGDEWKERLSCRVEGREYKGVPERKAQAPPSRTESPAAPMGIGARSQKEQNESFFEKMGSANASRPDGLPPSQGGKYGGFGSAPPERSSSQPRNNAGGGDAAMPGFDDFEKNPMGAITQGWGWFASSVTKQAKVVNEGYIKPTAQKIAESEFTAQARSTATHLATNVQTGTKSAAESFNKFIDESASSGGGGVAANNQLAGSTAKVAAGGKVEPEKKDFWDTFGGAAPVNAGTGGFGGFGGGLLGGGGGGSGGGAGGGGGQKKGAIGTAAMRKKEEEKWEDF